MFLTRWFRSESYISKDVQQLLGYLLYINFWLTFASFPVAGIEACFFEPLFLSYWTVWWRCWRMVQLTYLLGLVSWIGSLFII